MKKAIIATMTVILATLLLASCGSKNKTGDTSDDTTKADTTAALTMPDTGLTTTDTVETTAVTTASGEIGNDAAVEAAKNYLGKTDPDTGYDYAFSYDSRMNDNGTDYYKIRVSWYIEDQDRYSLCGYLLVTPDGSSVTKYDW